jgi:hypothetical protein
MFRINGYGRRMAPAMRKRLLPRPSYARFYQKLLDFCRTDRRPAMQARAIRAPPDLMQGLDARTQPALILNIGKS